MPIIFKNGVNSHNVAPVEKPTTSEPISTFSSIRETAVANNPVESVVDNTDSATSILNRFKSKNVAIKPKKAEKPVKSRNLNTFADLVSNKLGNKSAMELTNEGRSSSKFKFAHGLRAASGENKENIKDSKFIKPKYVDDKSLIYKASSYLKELLGEGK